jgi:ribosome-associated toxin RatA of RatAB toxin-antitoxin module
MIRARSILVLAAFVLSGLTASTEAQAQPASLQSVVDGLKDGSIKSSTVEQPGRSVRWGRAVGLVDAPVETVLKVVQNYAAYQTFMPHFRTSKVLSQRGASALVYMEATVAKGTMDLWAELKISPKANTGDAGTTQVIEAKMLKGNMDAMQARWELTPVEGGRTLVAFQLLMDPNLPLPSSFVSGENETAAKKTIRALRKVVATQTNAAAAKH